MEFLLCSTTNDETKYILIPIIEYDFGLASKTFNFCLSVFSGICDLTYLSHGIEFFELSPVLAKLHQ